MGDHDDHIHVGFRPGEGVHAGHGDAHVAGAAAAILKSSQWDDVVNRVAEIENPKVETPIEWHRPANESCKYERAQAIQGERGAPRQLKSVDELAPEKQLKTMDELAAAKKPCFGFGTPGEL
jgi:hypothetical protein